MCRPFSVSCRAFFRILCIQKAKVPCHCGCAFDAAELKHNCVANEDGQSDVIFHATPVFISSGFEIFRCVPVLVLHLAFYVAFDPSALNVK